MTPTASELLALAGRCEAATEPWKVRLGGERQRYTVMAHNDRFFIMTKPFNAQKTYLYTIADLERGVRGPCNLIFGLPCDVNTTEGAQEALRMIEVGDMEVSHRRCVVLLPDEAKALRARAAQMEASPPASPQSEKGL